MVGAYDFGNLLAVVPVTYYGGRPSSSKPKYIASGMVLISLGSTIFALPHFVTDRYATHSRPRYATHSKPIDGITHAQCSCSRNFGGKSAFFRHKRSLKVREACGRLVA